MLINAIKSYILFYIHIINNLYQRFIFLQMKNSLAFFLKGFYDNFDSFIKTQDM